MKKEKRVVTLKNKYISTRAEAEKVQKILTKLELNTQIRKVSSGSYLIEITNYETKMDQMQDLRNTVMQGTNYAIYKTQDTWSELKRRQLERDTRVLVKA